MSHNIGNQNGKDTIAFLGSRNDIWHRLGNEMAEGMSIEMWAKEAGLDWEAALCESFFKRDGQFYPNGQFDVVRLDTNYAFGHMTERYKLVQPAEVLEWFDSYIKHDDRFQLDVAGCLKSGEVIWATAKYNGDITVAGDNHKARLLMTTSFDGSYATTNKMTMTRVVCNNTLDVALAGDNRACIKTRHSTKFDAKKVGEELGNLAKSVESYKAMGDAMVQKHMSDDVVKAFFARLLKIDDKKQEDISTNKINQFNGLVNSYNETIKEGTQPNTQWCAMNAVTRYVDHNRQTRDTTGNGETEARFVSAQFGTGATMKQQAVKMLTDKDVFAELLKASFKPAEDFADVLRQARKPAA